MGTKNHPIEKEHHLPNLYDFHTSNKNTPATSIRLLFWCHHQVRQRLKDIKADGHGPWYPKQTRSFCVTFVAEKSAANCCLRCCCCCCCCWLFNPGWIHGQARLGFPTTHGWLWSKSIARNPCGPRCGSPKVSTCFDHILMNDDLRIVNGNLRVPSKKQGRIKGVLDNLKFLNDPSSIHHPSSSRFPNERRDMTHFSSRVVSNPWKNILVKMGSSFQISGVTNKKCVGNHPLVHHSSFIINNFKQSQSL